MSYQASPPVLRGSWTATAGQTSFRGTWSAQVVSGKPNAAQGSWTLISDANRVVLEGTWAADKTPRGWQGRWSARGGGRLLSGTWTRPAGATETLAQMIERTLKEEVAGSWRSGARAGTWRLSAAK